LKIEWGIIKGFDRKMKTQKQGYMYIVNGEKYLEEAIISANSLRSVDPTAHITLITNKRINSEIFDNIIIKPENAKSLKEKKGFKVKYMYKDSPYEKTFFIDSDTFFCDSCRELFDILDYFDMCIAQDPNAFNEIKVGGKLLKGYLAYNSGLIVFKKNRKNEKLFHNWYKFWNDHFERYELDQPEFMMSLLTSDSKVYVLQSIYNCRTNFFTGICPKEVKLIHGRHNNFARIKSILNSKKGNRAWDPRKNRIYLFEAPIYKKIYRKIKYFMKR
jgi:hypothetical protein